VPVGRSFGGGTQNINGIKDDVSGEYLLSAGEKQHLDFLSLSNESSSIVSVDCWDRGLRLIPNWWDSSAEGRRTHVVYIRRCPFHLCRCLASTAATAFNLLLPWIRKERVGGRSRRWLPIKCNCFSRLLAVISSESMASILLLTILSRPMLLIFVNTPARIVPKSLSWMLNSYKNKYKKGDNKLTSDRSSKMDDVDLFLYLDVSQTAKDVTVERIEIQMGQFQVSHKRQTVEGVFMTRIRIK